MKDSGASLDQSLYRAFAKLSPEDFLNTIVIAISIGGRRSIIFFFVRIRRPPRSPLFPSTTLFRSHQNWMAADKPPRNQSHEDDEALSDEELKKRGDIQIEIPTAKASKPSITPAAKAAHKSRADFIIALDIGHTPLRGGAISARGVFEYHFNRRLVAELFAQLQAMGFIRAFVINPQGDEISLVHRSAEIGRAHV